MPYLLYNQQFTLETEFRLPLSNRAFQYNDGFFETMILANGHPRFWPEHLSRMQEAATVLQLTLPAIFISGDFIPLVLEVAQRNACGPLARIKLKVWRAGEGLYTPQTDACDWLVTAQPATNPSEAPLAVGICQSIHTIPSPFSGFKGINSPVYVLASREKGQRQLEDLILLDPQGHLAELTAANLFWTKDRTLFTPSLQTGCLNGVLRRKLLAWANANDWAVQEGLFKPDVLLSSDLVFSGNVTGLRLLSELESQPLRTDWPLLQMIKESLFA